MRKILTLILIFISVISLTSCGPVSSYQALFLSTKQRNNELEVSFGSLKGTYIKKINNTNNMAGQIYFEITCSSGSFDVYYETPTQTKELLASVIGDESLKQTKGYVNSKEDVTIYIITNDKAKGSVLINLV